MFSVYPHIIKIKRISIFYKNCTKNNILRALFYSIYTYTLSCCLRCIVHCIYNKDYYYLNILGNLHRFTFHPIYRRESCVRPLKSRICMSVVYDKGSAVDRRVIVYYYMTGGANGIAWPARRCLSEDARFEQEVWWSIEIDSARMEVATRYWQFRNFIPVIEIMK